MEFTCKSYSWILRTKQISKLFTTLVFYIAISKFYQDIAEIGTSNFEVFDSKFEQNVMALKKVAMEIFML